MHLEVGQKYDKVVVTTIHGDITIRDVLVVDRVSASDGDHEYVLAVKPVACKASTITVADGASPLDV